MNSMRPKKTMEELNRVDANTYKKKEKLPIIVALDDIRSMNNVGAVFRTSDAFLVEKVYLGGITPCPPHRDIHKTALGAELSVEWEKTTHLKSSLLMLKEKGYQIISVEQCKNSVDFSTDEAMSSIADKVVIVMGNEVKGVDQEIIDISDLVIELPQEGTKHSLNVSVSYGIVIYNLFTKFRAR